MFIIDPITLKKVTLRTENGLSILKNYVKYFQNGGSDPEAKVDLRDAPRLGRASPPTESPVGSESKVDSPDDEKETVADEVKKSIENFEFDVETEESSITGTFEYQPPEVLGYYKDDDGNGTGRTNSLNTDIWSMGVTFFKLLTTIDLYRILKEIQIQNKNPNYEHNETQIKKNIEKAKNTQLLKTSLPDFITEPNMSISMKYIDFIMEEHKKYLSDENQGKLEQIFNLIKEMIKYKIEDRKSIAEVVGELKRITKINADDITIPFDESSYSNIVEKSKTHSHNTDLEEVTYTWGRRQTIGIYKIGNEGEPDETFRINDEVDKRRGCNNTNSCVIFKGEDKRNSNELLIHAYLSKKDTLHRYIVDFYTYKLAETNMYIYMEHVPQSLKEYIDDNFEIRELEKYYKKSYRQTSRPDKIAPAPEVEVDIYEKYEKETSGVELGGDECHRITKPCKLQGDKLGQGIKCNAYGTKFKCKTSNIELAIAVRGDNRIFEEKCIIMLKAAEALQFINNNNILHGDIKPENIVVQKKVVGGENKYLVKFIDVGASHIFMDNNIYKFTNTSQPTTQNEFIAGLNLSSSDPTSSTSDDMYM
jgi:serine/threonine protein kinase